MKKPANNRKLLRRYLDNLYTTEEAKQLLQSLPDLHNLNLLNELSTEVWEEAATQQTINGVEHEQYKREARQLLKRIEHKKRTWFRRFAVVTAGTAAIICFIMSGIYYLSQRNESEKVYLEASTSYGEHKKVLLPDGTQLTLNSCSYVRYPNKFTGDERRIELEGEGYFQVQRNEEQPFIVQTRRFDVRVLGTCFDVKSYSSDEVVSVEVESGKIQVELPEAMMRLQAKEQILINTISGDYNKRRDNRPVAIWKKGSLRFNNTPIHDVAKELERMYNCRITFSEGKFDNHISGEHDNKSLEAVLQSIEYTSGIRYKKEGNRILLYK